MTIRTHLARFLASAVLIVATASACDSRSSADAEVVDGAASPPASLAELVDGAPSISADHALAIYSGHANVSAIFDQPVREYVRNSSIKLAVVGTVASYAEGPHFAEYEGDRGGTTTVMAVKLASVLKGGVPASRTVYVQMPLAVEPGLATGAVPVGSAVALLLSEPTMTAKINPDAGRPKGEPVWIAGAQGLIVSNGPGGGVTYPGAALVDPDVRLDVLVTDGMKALGRPIKML